MNNKAIIESAFVGYEEFCRSRRVLPTSAEVGNTLLDLQNSSYPTQPHSIIANYTMIYKNDERLRDFFGLFVFIVV